MPQNAALLEEEGEVIQAVVRDTASAPLDSGFRRNDGGRANVPFAQRKGTRTSEASAQGMPEGPTGRDHLDSRFRRNDGGRANVPFAQRKGTRTSEASAQGMPEGPAGRAPLDPGFRRNDGGRANVPFAQRKGTRTSEASAQGMPEGERGRDHHVITLPNNDNRSVDLQAVMQHLGDRGCVNVLAETGQKLTGELFDLKLVDKVVTYMATDKIIGGTNAFSPVGGTGPASMNSIARLKNTRIEQLGDDIAVIGYVDYA